MQIQFIDRLMNPVNIHYSEDIPIEIIGLFVNLVFEWLLQDDGEDSHQLDLRCFFSVVASAVIYILEIVGFIAGEYFGGISYMLY